MTMLIRLLQLALVVGGAIGAVAAFSLNRDLWPWPMPDLAHRFLAAAAAGYVTGGLVALLRRTLHGDEMLLATVLFYGVPLGFAMVISREQIDWDEPIAVTFVAVTAPAVAIAVAGLISLRSKFPVEGSSVHPILRGYLLLLAVVAGFVGGFVYIAPRDAGVIWPWAELPAWTPLDSRLIASMLLTVAGGALLAALRGKRDSARVILAMLWAYCVVASVGLALHAQDVSAFRTEDLVYIAIFLMILLDTALLYFLLPARGRSRG